MRPHTQYCTRFLFTIFFVLILFAGEVTLLSCITIYQSSVRHEIQEALHEGYDPGTLIQIWYDPREPENHIIVQEEGSEIQWDGVFYDVVSSSQSGEETLYLCIPDERETSIAANIVQLSGQESNPLKAGMKGKILLEQFIHQGCSFSIRSPYCDRLFACIDIRAITYCPEIYPPPPRFA